MEDTVRGLLFAVILVTAVGIASFTVQGQNQQTGRQGGTAQPVAAPADGAAQFPLAAPAGKDSGASSTSLPGAVNQGPFNPLTWKYGDAFNPPAGSKI